MATKSKEIENDSFQLQEPETASSEIVDTPVKTQSGRRLLNKNHMENEALEYLHKIVNLNVESFDEKENLLQELSNIAAPELKKFSNANSSFLAKLMETPKTDIHNSFDQFKKAMTYLDPHATKKSTFSKVFSFLTPKESVEEITEKREKKMEETKKIIDDAMSGLYTAKNSLMRTNAAIEVEQEYMISYIDSIESKVHLLKSLNQYLDEYIAQQEAVSRAKGGNSAYAKFLKDEFSFRVKQRVMDIQTNFGVSMQTYLFLDVTRKQNQELMQWISRCTTVDLEALRTALVNKNHSEFTSQASDFIKNFEKITLDQKDKMVSKAEDIERETHEIKQRIERLRVLTGSANDTASVAGRKNII